MKLELPTLAPILLIYQVLDKTKIQIISINLKYSQMHTATLLLLIPHLQNIMTDCLVRTPTPLCIIVTFLHILHPIQKNKSEQQQLCRRSYLFCGYSQLINQFSRIKPHPDGNSSSVLVYY